MPSEERRRCPKCGGEISCHTCIDGDMSGKYYNPGEYESDEGEIITEPEACPTCDMPYVNHRCKCVEAEGRKGEGA